MMAGPDEDDLLRSVAIRNAQSILAARQRAEAEVLRTKEELAHSLAIVRGMLDSTWDGILVTDGSGRILDFNQQLVAMWRIPAETLHSRQHGDLVEAIVGQFPEETRDAYRARLDAIYSTSPPDSFDELALADGRVFERFSRVQSVDGRIAGRVWSFRDITPYRRAEEALRDETRTLERLNRAGASMASTLDLPTLLQMVTDAATELSGARCGAFFYRPGDAAGEPFQLCGLSGAPREAFVGSGDPRATSLFGPTLRGEGPIRRDDVLRDGRDDGLSVDAATLPTAPPVRSYLAVPVVSRSGEVIGGLFFGHPEMGVFTERAERLVVSIASQAAMAIDNARLYEARKELLESERSARSDAERASALKDEFLATVSHELRTPLNAILGWVRILRSQPAGQVDLDHALEVMERNANVQVQLIEDLLDMSRITSGKMRLDVRPLNLVGVIEAALETVRPASDAKGILLRATLDRVAGPVTGDANRLQQVVWNLLSNAIKFTPRHGCVDVTLRRVGAHVEIAVADTGVGIRAELTSVIFDRFKQGDSSRTRSIGGLGLGLSIVRHLVEQHGGTVHVTSRGEGTGATFTVRLPLATLRVGEGWRSGPGAGSPLDFTTADLSGVRVLVVDDQADARDLIQRVLGECRADVVTASSPEEALAAVEATRPHVLVSDIGMPDVDGYELLRRVRALGQARGGGVPAVALTAFARSEDRTRALRAGYLVHVAKPVEPSELVATVASVVGRTGQPAP